MGCGLNPPTPRRTARGAPPGQPARCRAAPAKQREERLTGLNPHSQIQRVEEEHEVFPLEIIQGQFLELPIDNGRAFKERGVLRDGRGEPRGACGDT